MNGSLIPLKINAKMDVLKYVLSCDTKYVIIIIYAYSLNPSSI